jgi:hypothetical protein
MTLRISFLDKQMGQKFERGMKRQVARVNKAFGATARAMSDQIKTRGDRDITQAGNFGTRWTNSFHAIPMLKGRDYTIKVFSTISYFNIFEFGGLIQGKPMLWIPLSFAADAKGVLARNFPGGLFRVDRLAGGAPLLLSRASKEPKYFGKESVTMPKKFHIRQICRDVSRNSKQTWKRNFK